MARIDAFFKLMSEEKASDLHLATNNPPMLRINGELVRVDYPPLQNDDLKAMVYEIAPEGKIKVFEETLRCRLRLRGAWRGAISRQFFPAEVRHLGRLPFDPIEDFDRRRSGPAAGV